MVIAIDGPAASGKSTTARLVAQKLGYLHLDTGAMYRAMTLKILALGIDPGDSREVARIAGETAISLEHAGNSLRIILDGEDVTGRVRTPEVTAAVSQVSAVGAVRELMVREQRRLARSGGVVLEGRDIGTVVLPEADLKVWLIADPEARAVRRQKEMKEQNIDKEIEEIRHTLQARDRKDSERELSPLKRAADAAEVDTTEMTIEEQVEAVVERARGMMS